MNFEICQYLNLKDQLRFALVDKRTWNQITTNMFTSLGRLFTIEQENMEFIREFIKWKQEPRMIIENRWLRMAGDIRKKNEKKNEYCK